MTKRHPDSAPRSIERRILALSLVRKGERFLRGRDVLVPVPILEVRLHGVGQFRFGSVRLAGHGLNVLVAGGFQLVGDV